MRSSRAILRNRRAEARVLQAAWSKEERYYIAERGYRLYCEGRLPEAGILFEGLVALDPGDAYCHKALAAIHICLGRPELAIQHLDLAIARDRHDAGALAARCEALIIVLDLDSARRDLDSLASIPHGAEDARRLELCLQHSKRSIGAPASQLPASPPR